jgi:hypothetical protein
MDSGVDRVAGTPCFVALIAEKCVAVSHEPSSFWEGASLLPALRA